MSIYIYKTTYDIGGGLRFVPSLLYVIFLGFIYRSYRKSLQYTIVLPTSNVWGRIALLMLIVSHRV